MDSRFEKLGGFLPTQAGRPVAEHQLRMLRRDEVSAWSLWEELRRELSRSRRYSRSFTLVRFPCGRSGTSGRRPRGRRTMHEDERVRILTSLVRDVDRVWAHGENVYLLLPECNRAMAEGLLSRIRRPLSEHLQAEEAWLACFPEDAVASGALLAVLLGLPVRPQTSQQTSVFQQAEGGESPTSAGA